MKTIDLVYNFIIIVDTMIKGQYQMVECVMVSTKVPCLWHNKKNNFVTLQKGQRKVKVKTIGLVHNFIILANCLNHDRRSMSNGSMSYGIHKVSPIHGTTWKNY